MTDMTPEEIMNIEDTNLIDLYAKRPIIVERGSGARIYDVNGREYIDCGASFSVCNVGHANPKVVKAIQEQAEKLMFIQLTYYNETRAKLAKLLVDIAPSNLTKIYLANSGTECVEATIKFARGSTGRKEIIAMTGAFHGRTMGALTLTFKPQYKKPFGPMLPDVKHARYGDIESLIELISDQTAAVILEPIQGEGGVIVPPEDYLQQVRALCDEHGALLILDEIQTGLGRTGKMFACEHYDVQPDLMCLAKSIAGGMPMGAVLGTPEAMNIPRGTHGTTFGGNPLAAAAATAALEYLVEEDLPARAGKLGEDMIERIKAIDSPVIREVRGKGLMIGIELKKKAGRYLQALMDEGVLCLPAGALVIRLLPPLVITEDEIDRVVTALEKVLTAQE